MRLRRLLVLVTLLVPGAYASPSAAPDRTFVKDTRDYMTRLEKLGFAGVLLVEQDGKVLLSEGYGLADRENRVPWTSRTICDIGSITKQFTAAAILTLEQDGKLATTDPLSRHFADAPEDKRDITIHQLLTHTSGIIDLENADDYDPIERDEFMRRIFAQPLASPPGETFAYTNAGYSILGAIIERITGQSYEAFVRERLFLPRKLNDTGYIIPTWDTRRLARGYGLDGPWGTGVEKPMGADGPFWVLRANGGIHSTAEDMRRWCDALLAGRVLSPASMKRLWTPYADEGGGTSYAYGWSISPLASGDTLIVHDGGNGIWGATAAMLQRRRVVIFLQTNVSAHMPLWSGIMSSVADRLVNGAAYPSIPDLAEVPASRLAEVSGSYRFDDANRVDVTPDGKALRLTAYGQDAFALITSTRDVDLAHCRTLCDRMQRIMSSLTSGDFAPLADAYGRKVTPEYLQGSWERYMTGWTEQYGAYTGFEVVGAAMLRERDMTLVRLTFQKGHVDRAYVSMKSADHTLLGVSQRGLSRDVHCVPVKGGGFASWDTRSGDSRPFAFEAQEGKRLLQMSAGGRAFTAARAE